MRTTTDKLSPWVQKSACGRDLDAQLKDVASSGQHGAPQVLRAMALAANGFGTPPQQADLAVIFGCYRPFSTPEILREVAWLFQTLGIDHTWLEKENCCGLPMLHQVAAEDRPLMLESANNFVQANAAAAAQKGAARLAYCCAGCTQVAQGVTEQGHDKHAYILDVLLEALKGQSLKVQPMKVLYFEGCHTSYKKHFRQVELNWANYREFLNNIDGLTVGDAPRGLCCKIQPERVIAAVQDAQAEVLVCACSGCNVALKAAGKGRVRVMSYPALLAQCLGGMAASL